MNKLKLQDARSRLKGRQRGFLIMSWLWLIGMKMQIICTLHTLMDKKDKVTFRCHSETVMTTPVFNIYCRMQMFNTGL